MVIDSGAFDSLIPASNEERRESTTVQGASWRSNERGDQNPALVWLLTMHAATRRDPWDSSICCWWLARAIGFPFSPTGVTCAVSEGTI